MTSSSQQLKQLRAIAHRLKPIVTIAQKGLAESVCKELDRALSEHELIKIKVMAADRTARQEIAEEVSRVTGAQRVQQIGNIVVLYRAARQPDQRLSNILRHKTAGG
jgi:RNA-binding protein